MDNLYVNKICAGVLIALMVAFLSSYMGDQLVAPKPLKENAFPITVPEGMDTGAKVEAKELAPISPLLAKADAAAGEQVAKKCLQCHTFEKGGATKIGPNLWNVVGAKPGHHEGFAYSDAMKNVKEDWNYEHLNKFLHKPQQTVAGTKMSFAGLEKDSDRANLIAYMRTQADSPQPLPAAQ